MFYDIYVNLCLKKGESANRVASHLGIASGTVSEWKNGRIPQNRTLHKIADYFDVSVDYLLGNETNNKNHYNQEIRSALFGDDQEVTDEMWEELKLFVEFLKEKHKRENK